MKSGKRELEKGTHFYCWQFDLLGVRQNVSKSYFSFLFSSNMSPVFLLTKCHFP